MLAVVGKMVRMMLRLNGVFEYACVVRKIGSKTIECKQMVVVVVVVGIGWMRDIRRMAVGVLGTVKKMVRQKKENRVQKSEVH